MTDVAPELLEQLEEQFRNRVYYDKRINGIWIKVEKGTATYAEAAQYAAAVSDDLAKACRWVLNAEALPDGRMYYNIADRVLRPMIGEQTEMIAEVCEQTQAALNQAAGVGMKTVRVTADADRVQGILDEAAGAERFSDVAERVYEHIDNLGRHTVDESVRRNADAQWKAGLAPKVIRTGDAGCCEWCADVAGVYDYAEVSGRGDDVWRRHANCGCLIEYNPRSGKRSAVDNYTWRGRYESEGKGSRRHAVWKADMSDGEIAARIERSHSLAKDTDPKQVALRQRLAAEAAANTDRRGIRR